MTDRSATSSSSDELAEPWASWAAARPPARHLHVDSAAAGRSSHPVVDAVRQHLLAEASLGAYVAEGLAEEQLEGARATVGDLLGVPSDGVAFVESASAGRAALLAAWPFERGDTVAVVPSEWGPNLTAFIHRGLAVVELAVTADGAVDLDALATLLHRDPPAVVHLTQVASHRPLVQPVAAAVAISAAADVPVWVDGAQALGHVDTACGADAIYATGRKWLNGPRGVGIVAVAERRWSGLQVMRLESVATGAPPMRHLESHEANVAGRVGLAVALAEHVVLGPDRVRRRLAEVGRMARAALRDMAAWQLVGDVDAPSAITALRPTSGHDVAATRARLLSEHGIVTTAALPTRAPREMTEPLLRISPHVDATPAMLDRVRRSLEGCGGPQA